MIEKQERRERGKPMVIEYSEKVKIEPAAKQHGQVHRIIELYWFEGLSISDVADEMGMSIGRISQIMRDQNIPRKPLSEQRKDRGGLRWDTERLQYLDWLTPKQQQSIRKFFLEKKTADEIGDEESISSQYFSERLRNAVESLETIAEDQNSDR